MTLTLKCLRNDGGVFLKAKGILENVGGSFVMQAVNILTNLILPPMIIACYGSKINGLIGTITQIISYVSLVGAGLSVATTQALYKPLAENDHETVSGMMRTTGNVFNRIGVLFLLISSLTAFLYPFLIKSDLEYFFVVLLMLIMSISGAMEFFATGRFRSLLYADRKIYVYSLIQSACLIISTGLAIVCIKLDLSILWTQSMISLVYVLRGLCLSIYVKKAYSYINKDSKPVDDCISKRKDAMYHQLIGLLVTGSQAILLSIFVGLEAASIYGVYNIVFSGLQSICVQMSNSVVPYIGRVYALGNNDEMKRKYDLFELVFFIIISVIFATSFIMIKPFIGLYTKSADINYVDELLAILFVIRGFSSCFRLPAQGLINAAGFFKETKKAATIEAIICIVIELMGVQFWGIYGIMLGNLAALVWRGFEMVLYTNKYIISRISKGSIVRIGQATIAIVVSYYFSQLFIPINSINHWLKWLVFALVSVLISSIVTLTVYFFSERKNMIKAVHYFI